MPEALYECKIGINDQKALHDHNLTNVRDMMKPGRKSELQLIRHQIREELWNPKCAWG